MRILVAMSGGIDSSVVAHMLKSQGHDVVGVRFTLWSDPLAPPLAHILPSKCCSTQTAARAKKVADNLGIPLHILNLEQEFYSEVVQPFLHAHRQGSTPNPCIGCNRMIKFGKLLELSDELGCEKLATGHYARVAMEKCANSRSRSILLEAVDGQKDQSYYLYGLDQCQLKRVLFPLGSMHKHEVFSLAKHYGIPYEEESYRESQDLCFFPEKSPTAFLLRHLKDAIEPGPIVRRDGEVVGTHKGLPLYTIGQRRGLNIGGLPIPLEVVAKDMASNTLVAEEQGKEKCDTIAVMNLRWISWKPESGDTVPFACRTRSLSPKARGKLHCMGDRGTFHFDRPRPPTAPGQALVLYRGEEVVGGGEISGVFATSAPPPSLVDSPPYRACNSSHNMI